MSLNSIDIIPRPLEVKAGEGLYDPCKGGVLHITDPSLPYEGYELAITPDRAEVRASSDAGFKMAAQTLRQLLSEDGRSLRCCRVKDAPRFGYRGLLVDCSRHFYTVDEIRRILDIMAFYRLNRFHWHLTDDHGWRIEIKRYPRLVEAGAFGDIGSQPDWTDDKLVGEVRNEGFYSQEEIRSVVAYAGNLGITVIPELDMPGHMTSALAAYPELGCTGGPYKVINFVAPRSKGFGKENLCIGKEEVFTFVENVLCEVMELFPSQYIHIGGDECEPDRWNACPHCRRRMEEEGIKGDSAFSAAQYLQNYFTHRVQAFLEKHGRKMIGWDEILDGQLNDGATIMSWRGTEGGIKAARRGMDAVMCPGDFCYLDKCQSENRELEPVAFGRKSLSVEKVYSYEPLEGLSDSEASHILGVQGNLWCDVISTAEYLEYMLLPRLAALSEVQWCAPEVKDWKRFRKALDSHVRHYESAGYVYAKHLWGVAGLPGHEYKVVG